MGHLRCMSEIRRTSQAERDETPSERADRNFAELVQELRVSQTGVQILFAFLLTLGFTAAFPQDSEMLTRVLTAALLAAACSAICFMAPVAIHRSMFRLGGKERIVFVTHRFALAGLFLLGVAMLLSIWLVVAFLFTPGTATAIDAALAVLMLILWVALPWRLRTIEMHREQAQRGRGPSQP